MACLLPAVTTGMALLAGIGVAFVIGNPWSKTTKKLTTPLLQGAVVALGMGMDLRVVLGVGLHGLAATFVGIASCLLLGALLSRWLGVARDVGVLVSVGTAICGGSAIAAVVPVLRAKEDDATVALAVVFLLNAVGLVLFPWAGHALQLDEARFGLWAALSIHDTSSVVGAGSAYGPLALQTATTVKLARALWIVPVAFAIGAWHARATRDDDAGARQARPAGKPPWFVAGFIVAAAVATYVPGLHDVGLVVSRGARQVLVVTLFLIGSHVTRASLRAVGVRPLLLGVLLWVAVASTSLVAITAGLLD
jgi:uncharacterized integral membrane protein (TIGR00698 family)